MDSGARAGSGTESGRKLVRRWAVAAALVLVVVLGGLGADRLRAAATDVWTTWYAADYAGVAPVSGHHMVAWADNANNKIHFYSISKRAEWSVTVPGYALSGYSLEYRPRMSKTGTSVFVAFAPNGQSDLFLGSSDDVARPQPLQITNDLWGEGYYTIGGDQVVGDYVAWYGVNKSVYPWQFGLFLYDVAHGTTTKFLDRHVATDTLVTDGHYVAWWETLPEGGNPVVRVYDIGAKFIETISDPSERSLGPHADGGIVAWTAYKPGTSESIGVRVWRGGQVLKFDNKGWVLDIGVESANNRYVVWMEPAAAGWDIVVYELNSAQIRTRISVGNGWGLLPRVSGRLLALHSFGEGSNVAVHDLLYGDTQLLTTGGSNGLGINISDEYIMWYNSAGQIYVGVCGATPTTTTVSTTTTTTSPTTTTSSTSTTSSTTTTTVPGGKAFSDVPSGHPHYSAIMGMAQLGLIHGYDDGTFRPQNLVLRQQFAKMIVGATGVPVSESDWSDANPPFLDCGPDVLDDLYPHDFIAVAKAYGLTRGRTPTSFAPVANITRAQLITMVVRAAQDFGFALNPVGPGYYTWGMLRDYNDPNHGDNAQLAEYNGLLNGLQYGNPVSSWIAGNATRGEVAQVLWNLMQLPVGAEPDAS